MERSDEIAKLATALAKAQGVIEDAEKDSLNPHFQSRYASLAAVRHAIRKPLSENGLAYVQLPRANGKAIEIKTVLFHESGGLVSVVGLASDENDDGELAQGRADPNGAANPRTSE